VNQPSEATLKIQAWRHDPVLFVQDNFGVTLDEWQREGLLYLSGATVMRRRLAMKACTGPGKSAFLAWVGWHRLSCFAEPGGHPKGAALSGQGRDNLQDNLWAELSKWQQRSMFLSKTFTWNRERIAANDHPQDWFLSARSYPKDANAEAVGQSISGLHSPFPFILLDETGDMPPTVGLKAQQIFTGGTKDGLIAMAGNPTSTTGLLYHVCTTERQNWRVVTITADPDDPRRTPRVDIEHAREQIQTHGRENPWVMSTILGEFPSQGFNSLISLEEAEHAMRRVPKYDDYAFTQKRIGVDVARFGDDRTCIFPRQGLNAAKPRPIIMRSARTNEISDRVQLARANWARTGTADIADYVDGTGGYGAGVIDALMKNGLSPLEVNFAGKASDPRFYNKRAEMWWNMAAWIRRGGCLPNLPELVKELTAPTYSYQGGKILLEPKDKIKERLGFSPDLADALALTFTNPDQPALLTVDGKVVSMGAQHKADYDPYAEERL
jgi:phage terminase large subunit